MKLISFSLFVLALLICHGANADELYQIVTSATEINPDDVYVIASEDGEYALQGTSSKPFATTKTGKANYINGYLLATTTHVADNIKLVPVEGKTDTYLLQYVSDNKYVRGGTANAKDLSKTTSNTDSRLEWKIVSNSKGANIQNTNTSLYITNNTSEFSCKTTQSSVKSCLYKKVTKDDDVVLTKNLDSYSSTILLTSTDYDFSETNGLKVYIVTDANKSKVTLQEVKQVRQGTPVILYGDKNHYIARKKDMNSVPDLTNNILKKGGSNIYGDGQTTYAIAEKDGKIGFYRVKSGVQIPAGKVYLVINDTDAKEFFDFDGEEVTLGIDNVYNGHIEPKGRMFNINGQQVTNGYKGIVIMNGKKYLNR